MARVHIKQVILVIALLFIIVLAAESSLAAERLKFLEWLYVVRLVAYVAGAVFTIIASLLTYIFMTTVKRIESTTTEIRNNFKSYQEQHKIDISAVYSRLNDLRERMAAVETRGLDRRDHGGS